uniref:PID domain-containing protein n=1 Tax=Trichuris muris TaxID=70415 RepID=A0A5S6QTB1_TRIMR
MSKTMNRVTRLMQNTAAVFKRNYTFEEAVSAGEAAEKGRHNWIFPPDTLTHGQIEFVVKFLGEVPVEQPKGIEMTKEAVQKLRFNLQLKRSHGYKLQKVLLQISINGVNILDCKTKRPLYQHPLHRISFCADDKQDKRVFAYIAKRGPESPDHDCFVFLCNKLAEEITLTVGEAFDLAYRRFLENNGRDLEVKKQLIILRKRIQELEDENTGLKEKLAGQQRALSRDSRPHSPLINGIVADGSKESNFDSSKVNRNSKNWESFEENLSPVQAPSVPTSPVPPPPIPARPSLLEKPLPNPEPLIDPFVVIDPLTNPLQAMAKVSEPLEPTKLQANTEAVYDPEFDPRANEHSSPSSTVGNPVVTSDIFGDLGMVVNSGQNNGRPNLREGFSQGITFGNDDLGSVADFGAALTKPNKNN